MNSENHNKLRAFYEAWNTNSMTTMDALADELYSTDFVLHDNGKPGEKLGIAGVKAFVKMVVENTNHIQLTVQALFGEENLACCRFRFCGISNASGKDEPFQAMCISRFENGKIVEEWQIAVPEVRS